MDANQIKSNQAKPIQLRISQINIFKKDTQVTRRRRQLNMQILNIQNI